MVSIKLFDLTGKQLNDISVASEIFEKEPHKQAMFDCVIAENASTRQGTHSTLTKGEVRGGGKKPWRQKHTGRARTGSTRNPHWTGGGVAFGPKPNRNYAKKVNKKVQHLGMRSAFGYKLINNAIFALSNDASLEKPSTKSMAQFIKNINFTDKKVLIIVSSLDNNIQLSTNNMPKVTTKLWSQVSVKDILNANVVIAQENAFNSYKEVIA